jgi:predicted Zn-dependent protease
MQVQRLILISEEGGIMTRTNLQILIFVALAAILFGSCSEQAQPSLPPPTTTEQKSIEQLKAEVDALLSSADDVTIRSKSEDIFDLVDRLIASKNDREATTYLGAALQRNPWALEYQMLHADLLQAKGETAAARQKAELVREYAEKDDVLNHARKFLGEPALEIISEMSTMHETDISLVIVPVGKVDTCILAALRDALHEELMIPIQVRDAHVSIPGFRRDPSAIYLSELRSRLEEGVKKDRKLAAFLAKNGFKAQELEQDSTLIDAYRKITFAEGGTDSLSRFDAMLEQVANAEKQWDIYELKNALKSTIRPYATGKVYFMGVADLDVFAAAHNFVFGVADKENQLAMITYRRFTAEFNNENPNRKRLVERTLKQSLSSIGFMLGVPRCSMPTCARAYPNSLAEHDAKSTALCGACKSKFEEVLGRKLSKRRDGE